MCMSCRFIETAVKMFTGHAIWKPVSCEMWPVKLRRAMNVFVNVQCECKPSVLHNKAELDPRLRNLWRTRHQNVTPVPGFGSLCCCPLEKEWMAYLREQLSSLLLDLLSKKHREEPCFWRCVVVNSLEFLLVMKMGLRLLIYLFQGSFVVNTAPLITCRHW